MSTTRLFVGFENQADLRGALNSGLKPLETLTPFEVDDFIDRFHPKRDWVRIAGLCGGITGLVSAFFMEWYASTVSAPLEIGGRPLNSWPAFIPVTFVLTILCSALSVLGGWIIRLKLPWLSHPAFEAMDFSRKEFGLLMEGPAHPAECDELKTRLRKMGATRIEEVEA